MRYAGGLCFPWFRVKRDFFPSFPSLLPANVLIFSSGAWPCAGPVGRKTLSDLHYRFTMGQPAFCFTGTGFYFVLSFF